MSDVIDMAHEMACLAAVEAGTPEDAFDSGAAVLLEHLLNDGGAWLTIDGATEVRRLLEEMRR